MGKINDMKKNKINMSYIRNKIKPPMKKKGLRGFATLVSPTAKKYRLSKEQRNLQLTGRLTIAAIMTTLSIFATPYAVASYYCSQNPIETPSSDTLNKNQLLYRARQKIGQCVYPDDKSYDLSRASYDRILPMGDFVSITFQYLPKDANKYCDAFYYSKSNNENNADEINQLCNVLLEMENSKNPSQEDLQKLENMIHDFDPKSFRLTDGNIIKYPEKEKDKDHDFER